MKIRHFSTPTKLANQVSITEESVKLDFSSEEIFILSIENR